MALPWPLALMSASGLLGKQVGENGTRQENNSVRRKTVFMKVSLYAVPVAAKSADFKSVIRTRPYLGEETDKHR